MSYHIVVELGCSEAAMTAVTSEDAPRLSN